MNRRLSATAGLASAIRECLTLDTSARECLRDGARIHRTRKFKSHQEAVDAGHPVGDPLDLVFLEVAQDKP